VKKEEKLSFVQRLVRSLGSWGSDMEAESRKWIASCADCKTEKSLWDHGGVRWKAAGNPSVRLKCSQCGGIRWHSVRYCEPQ
jgi:hypothetical protein